jgi:C_GCAxxG_C_C family probable redox protein
MKEMFSAPKEREKFLSRVEEYAADVHRKYGNCAQATMKALLDCFEIDLPMLYKACSGLGGGVATMYDSACGALMAGVMCLSMKYGRGSEDLRRKDGGKEKLISSNDLVGKFYKWFEWEFGSPICRDLRKKWLGVDLDFKIPWQSEMAEQLGLHEDGCFKCVGRTARKAAELLIDEEAFSKLITKREFKVRT